MVHNSLGSRDALSLLLLLLLLLLFVFTLTLADKNVWGRLEVQSLGI
jgi:hypothetical protein